MATEIQIADKPTLDDARQHASNASAYSLGCLNAVGDVGNTANANGTIHAKISNLNNNVGSNADASNAAGSVHGKLKDLKAAISSLSLSPIKSIQRGTHAGINNASNISITISSVNPAKCIVLFDIAQINGYDPTYMPSLVSLTNTTLTTTASGKGNMPYAFSWQVIEFN